MVSHFPSRRFRPALFYCDVFVLSTIQLPTRKDVANVCKASRPFESLATPILHRSVIFRDSQITDRSWQQFPADDDVSNKDIADELSFGIFYRLLDDRNERLRAWVHDLTLEGIVRLSSKLQPPHDLLTTLVNKLPNLENV